MLQSIVSSDSSSQALNISELGSLHKRRLDTISEALELRKRLPSNNLHLPDVLRYIPWDEQELDIQRFNLYGELPRRFNQNCDENDVAMWFLTQPLLQRLRLASFLLSENYLAHATMQEMMKKVCVLESAQSFVDGLRYLLPITGLWEYSLALLSRSDSSNLNNSKNAVTSYLQFLEPLRETLCLYCAAHLSLSKSPLVAQHNNNNNNNSTKNSNNVNHQTQTLTAATHLALVCLATFLASETLHDTLTPLLSFNEFLLCVKQLNINQSIVLTQQQWLETHQDLVSRCVTSLSSTTGTQPQQMRVFALPLLHCARNVTLRCVLSHSETQQAASQTLSGDLLLTGDTLYLFDTEQSNKNNKNNNKDSNNNDDNVNIIGDTDETQSQSADKDLARLLTGPLKLVVPLCRTVASDTLCPNNNSKQMYVPQVYATPLLPTAHHPHDTSVSRPLCGATLSPQFGDTLIQAFRFQSRDTVSFVCDTPVSLLSCVSIQVIVSQCVSDALTLCDTLEELLLCHVSSVSQDTQVSRSGNTPRDTATLSPKGNQVVSSVADNDTSLSKDNNVTNVAVNGTNVVVSNDNAANTAVNVVTNSETATSPANKNNVIANETQQVVTQFSPRNSTTTGVADVSQGVNDTSVESNNVNNNSGNAVQLLFGS